MASLRLYLLILCLAPRCHLTCGRLRASPTRLPPSECQEDQDKLSVQAQSTDNETYLFVDLNDRTNLPWEELKATLVIGSNTHGPALGSTIAVNHDLIQNNVTGHEIVNRMIPTSMMIHTPTSTYIGRPYFHWQSRWYQEDKNTQIFRMFPGDDNIASDRTLAPRVEAFNDVAWKRGDGWFEFSARYTFVRLRPGAVFQIKHNNQYWSMQLVVSHSSADAEAWDLVYKNLRYDNARRVVETDILHKSVDVRVLDDGTFHQVYVNDVLRAEGNMTERLDTEYNKARWGFYSPGSSIDRDILLFVTGVYVGPANAPTWSPIPTLRTAESGHERNEAQRVNTTCNYSHCVDVGSSIGVKPSCPGGAKGGARSRIFHLFEKVIHRRCIGDGHHQRN